MAKWIDLEKTGELAQAMYKLFSKCHLNYKVGCFSDDCYECVRRFLSPYGSGHLFPNSDVQEVKHGKWILQYDNKYAKCSECGVIRNIESQLGWNYCPNCGAKMDGEDGEEN